MAKYKELNNLVLSNMPTEPSLLYIIYLSKQFQHISVATKPNCVSYVITWMFHVFSRLDD
jgi:hypothetical protein